jgi:hypothetical protein
MCLVLALLVVSSPVATRDHQLQRTVCSAKSAQAPLELIVVDTSCSQPYREQCYSDASLHGHSSAVVTVTCTQAAPVATVGGQRIRQAAAHYQFDLDDLVNDLQSVRLA